MFLAAMQIATASPVLVPDTNENSTEIVMVQPGLDVFFSQADAFISKVVENGKVDYAGIKSNPQDLRDLTEMIGNADLSAADKNTETAFYLNAYNISVISGVVEKYPIGSPLDISGFFDAKKYKIAGEYLTLNDLENKKLRPDPRVHFSLVCAANGCPKIMDGAFMPDKVQTQLDSQVKKAMNDSNFTRVDAGAKNYKISHIFEWYNADFTQNGNTVLKFINQYRDADIPADYSQLYYEYDWKLNAR